MIQSLQRLFIRAYMHDCHRRWKAFTSIEGTLCALLASAEDASGLKWLLKRRFYEFFITTTQVWVLSRVFSRNYLNLRRLIDHRNYDAWSKCARLNHLELRFSCRAFLE